MFIKRFAVMMLSLVVVLVGILAACAAPGQTPTTTATSTPTLTPTATPTGALAQVIEGAKKEGTVTVQLMSSFTPKSIERMKKEIKEMFGVDLTINFAPTSSFSKDLSQVLMEHEAGAIPTYSLTTMSTTYIASGMKAGAFEQVDWKPLVTQDTNPEAAMESPLLRGAIAYYTTTGPSLMYNPEKVPADQVPMTFSELANPKWNGKVGLLNTAEAYVRRAFIIGKEKVYADIRAIMKNKPVVGRYADQLNRYLLGEIWMGFVSSKYPQEAKTKGMPAAWQNLDYAEAQLQAAAMPKGANHSNAAKLVAIYLATPAGARLGLEEGYAGNFLYSGNFEYDYRMQSRKQGIPEYSPDTYPGLLEFVLSEEAGLWAKEVDLILKGAG